MGIIDLLFSKQIRKLSTQIANVHISQYRQEIKARYHQYNDYAGTYSGAKWPYGVNAPGSGFMVDHYNTRQNVRNAEMDSNVCRGITTRYADTIADTGLVRESTPDVVILGITPEQGEKWAEDVDHRFHMWAKSKKQHRSGQYNFYQSHWLYAKWMMRDNDMFVRYYYSRKRDLISSLQFEFIEPNQIRGDAYTSSCYQDSSNYDGIEKNPDGSEKAYKVWIQLPGEPYKYKDVTIPAIGPKSKRRMMIHGFQPEYTGQTRGFSPLATAIQEFQDITDFKESVIRKGIAQSSITMGVENDQLDPTNPLDGIIGQSAGPKDRIEDTGESFEATCATDHTPQYCSIPEATSRVPGSVGVFNLQRGDKLKFYENRSSAETFDSFVSSFVSYICAAVGMPIEVLLMKFNQNYSASRATLLIFWRKALILRAEMGADYLDPTFESWLSEEIAAGRIIAPGWSNPVLRAAWLTGNWIGSPMPQIDPLRAAKATEVNAKLGLTTLDRESRNLNGSSGKANRAKLTKEYKELPQAPFSKVATGGT